MQKLEFLFSVQNIQDHQRERQDEVLSQVSYLLVREECTFSLNCPFCSFILYSSQQSAFHTFPDEQNLCGF